MVSNLRQLLGALLICCGLKIGGDPVADRLIHDLHERRFDGAGEQQ